MRRPVVGVLMVVWSVVGSLQGSVQAQTPAMTPADVERIRGEVRTHMDLYYRLYSERDAKAIGGEVFLEPWLQLGGAGPQVMSTAPNETGPRFKTAVERLQASGWVRSAFPSPTVCVINPRTALATGAFSRFRADGSAISTSPITYLLTHTDAGWRIASYFGHAPGVTLSCTS